MKKWVTCILAGLLAVSMAACGNSGQPAATQAAAEETAAESAEQTTVQSEETAAETTAQAAAEAQTESFGALPHLTGSLADFEEPEAPQELSADEQETMDRAMRAYTPSADSLLVNNAKEFYYYSQMDKEAQALYDAMLMVAADPVDENNIVKVTVSTDPESDAFTDLYLTAYLGLLYDHPELFWLYNQIETDMGIYVPTTSGGSSYEVYFLLTRPYSNYEKQMKEFNSAAEAFLKDIDLKASDSEIERQIHDKLVNMVTYDQAVADNSAMRANFAHTAYGALVKNSEGTANYAVCDGYSQAYVYLLQQAGINAAVIVGRAGDDEASAGNHAWSVVQLDGDWYEVDSTWDDAGSIDEEIETLKEDYETAYNYYKEAAQDKEYREKIEHSMFNITTDEITTFRPGDQYLYTSKDGLQTYTLMFDSVHLRADQTKGLEGYAPLMKLAPVAKGTKY